MELRHLRYFVAVAEAGSFVGGSKRLNLAQPALSSQIHDLEHELGVTLFERQARGVRLTTAGREFLGHARAVLASSAAAVEEVRRLAGGVARLRVFPFGDAPGFVAVMRTALARYRAEHPRITVELELASYGDQPRALRAHELDVGFAFGVPGDLAGIRLRPVAQFVSDGALLSPDHPLSVVEAPSLADLARYPFYSLGARGAPPGLLQAPDWRSRIELARDIGHLRAMIAIGDGWSLGDPSYRGAGHRELIYRRLADGIAIPWTLNILTRDLAHEPHVDAFVDLLLDARRSQLARESAGTSSDGEQPAPHASGAPGNP